MAKGWPLPDVWKGQEGTLTVKFHHTRKQVLQIRVVSADVALKSKESRDVWTIGLACEIIAEPRYIGWDGTQPQADDPAKGNVELYAGMTKVHDPRNLQTAATRQYDIWPLGDSDDLERQKLADLVASATAGGFVGAKVKTARLEPGRSWDAGIITVALALTDTAEDVTNPISKRTTDPQGLTDSATVAAINADPAAPQDLIFRDTTSNEIHDTAELKVSSFGTRDTKDDIEYPASTFTNDGTGLTGQERKCVVQTSADLPTVIPDPSDPRLIIRTVDRVRLDRKHWQMVYVFAPRNAQQELEQEGSPHSRDPKSIADQDQITQLTLSPNPPSTPSPLVSGTKIKRIRSTQKTAAGAWEHTFFYARRDEQDDVEMPHVKTLTDPNDLESYQTFASQFDNSSPPADPSTPVGLKLAEKFDVPLHPTKSLRVWTFKKKDSKDELLLPKTVTYTDPQGLESKATVAALDATPAVPGGLVLRNTESLNVTPGHVLNVIEAGVRSTKDDKEMGNTATHYVITDAGNSEDATVINDVRALSVIGQEIFTARKADPSFDSVDLRRLDATHVLQVIKTHNPYQFFDGHVAGGRNPVQAILTGNGVSVFMHTKRKRGSNLWYVLLSPQTLYQAVVQFSFKRKVGMPGTLPTAFPYLGTSNSNTWLGLPAGTVTYMGCQPHDNFNVPVPRIAEMIYHFRFDSIGIFAETGIRMGWHITTQNMTNYAENSWIPVSALGWNQAGPLPQVDYDPFLTM